MAVKKIEDLSHKINVETILKCLWVIRDKDEFYFMSYGKDMINNCIKQKVKKEKLNTSK
jgi:hypothetical protein